MQGAHDPREIKKGRRLERSPHQATVDASRVGDNRALAAEEVVNIVGAFPAEGAARVGLKLSFFVIGEIDGFPPSFGSPSVESKVKLIFPELIRQLRRESREVGVNGVDSELIHREVSPLKGLGGVMVLDLKVGYTGEPVL